MSNRASQKSRLSKRPRLNITDPLAADYAWDRDWAEGWLWRWIIHLNRLNPAYRVKGGSRAGKKTSASRKKAS